MQPTPPDPKKDTSKPGREEEVITNSDKQQNITNSNSDSKKITNLPVKDNTAIKETEGERRFKEGMANNTDTAGSE